MSIVLFDKWFASVENLSHIKDISEFSFEDVAHRVKFWQGDVCNLKFLIIPSYGIVGLKSPLPKKY